VTLNESPEQGVSHADEYAGVAEFYDFVSVYRERPDVAFYVDAARESGGPVLEVGCGTGRVLIPTARAGVAIVGVDASPHMLAVCRRRLQKEPSDVQARVRLLQGDMRRIRVDQTFSLATIPFRPFQHLLTVTDQLACLISVRDRLTDSGRMVFDIFNPSLDMLVTKPVGEEFDADPEFVTDDGRRVVRRGKIVAHDRFSQVTQHELIYYVTHSDGRTERLVHAFSMRNTFRFEAEHLLVRAGFEIEHLYGDFDRSPYGSKYPGELIFVARKRHPVC
jgi:SAM-dependent methyltransferase